MQLNQRYDTCYEIVLILYCGQIHRFVPTCVSEFGITFGILKNWVPVMHLFSCFYGKTHNTFWGKQMSSFIVSVNSHNGYTAPLLWVHRWPHKEPVTGISLSCGLYVWTHTSGHSHISNLSVCKTNRTWVNSLWQKSAEAACAYELKFPVYPFPNLKAVSVGVAEKKAHRGDHYLDILLPCWSFLKQSNTKFNMILLPILPF